MREESYWKNRDSGPLNAFHTTAYHVQPASFNQVLAKRFQYVKHLIDERGLVSPGDLDITNEGLKSVFDRLVQTLLGEDRRYITLIEATAAGDTRRALDTVAAFLTSGHTNIDAILADEQKASPARFPVPFHEFLHAIMLRDHERYSETLSDILNIFQVTGSTDASNFNRVAVLGRVLKAKNDKSEVGNGFVAIETVVTDCHVSGLLPETTMAVLTLLISRRLIETETTIRDEIAPSRYVRATVSGEFYLSVLAKEFEYLDSILPDTPIGRGKAFKRLSKLFHELGPLSSENPWVRLERVKTRLDLCDEFINYLTTEFTNCAFRSEKDKFDVAATTLIPAIRTAFDATRPLIAARAERLLGRKIKQS